MPRRRHNESSPAAAAPLVGVRVLLVDNDADATDLMREVLELAGARVTSAESAVEALRLAGPFDVIVSDIAMPELDGYELMRRIRARKDGLSHVPAIALTGYGDLHHAHLSMRAGYHEHLTKPVDPAKLVEVVWNWARGGSPRP